MSENNSSSDLNNLKVCDDHEKIFIKNGYRNVKWAVNKCNACKELIDNQLKKEDNKPDNAKTLSSEANNKPDNAKTLSNLVTQASKTITQDKELKDLKYWITKQKNITAIMLDQLERKFQQGIMLSKTSYSFYEELTIKMMFFDKIESGLQRIKDVIEELEKKFLEKKEDGTEALNYNEKLELQTRINAILIKIIKGDSDLFDFVTLNQDTSATQINNIISKGLIKCTKSDIENNKNIMQEAFDELQDNNELQDSNELIE